MKRLRLTSITDLDFGVHRGRSIADLDHEFLCIFGPNESGKSTLAEYLQWMIGGPSGTAATAGRFTLADGGRDVGGRLLGTLDGDHLELMARFRIVQRGAPNDVRTGLLRGVDLDARAIARTLGELTPDDYAQLHRLRGAELGRGPEAESFSALFTQFAVGSAAASINPRTRLAELSAALRPASSRVTALARAERDLRPLVTAAEQRPVEADALDARIAQQRDEVKLLRSEISALQQQRSLVERARTIAPARRALHNADAELARLGAMDGPWRQVAGLADAVRRAHGDVERQRGALADSERTFEDSRSLVGLPAAALEHRELSLTDRSALLDASRAIGDGLGRVSAARSEHDALAATIDDRDSELGRLSAALGVEPPTGSGLLGRQTSLRDLLGEVGVWVEADRSAVEASGAAAARQAELLVLRANPGSPPPSTTRRFPPRVLVLMAGLVLAGVASILSPLAALALVVVTIIASVLIPERSTTSAPGNDDALDAARRALGEATQQAEAARGRAEAGAAGLRGALEALGAPVVTESSLARSHIQQLADLAGLVDTQHQDRAQLCVKADAIAVAEQRLVAARAHLDELLRSRDITTVPSVEGFGEWLGQYESAIAAARACTENAGRLQALEHELDVLIAPVAQALADDTWPQRLVRIADAAEQLGAIEVIEKQRAEATIILDAVGDDALDIDALLREHLDESALLARHDELTSEVSRLESTRDALISSCRELELEEKNLLDNEVLADLLEQRTELAEQLEEAQRTKQVIERSAAILAEVIDRYEAENQAPAVLRTQSLLQQVVPDWGDLVLGRDTDGKVLLERRTDAVRLNDSKLSDGARSLLYLALRLSFAADDAERRGIALPILCDDPLIHLDDHRRPGAIGLLAEASRVHQVVLFTCDTSTTELARGNGAHVISL